MALLARALLALAVMPQAVFGEATPSADELVRRLGAADFETREAAARQLAARAEESPDASAVIALKAGLRNHDVEIRTRCRRILTSVATTSFENRLQAFLDDREGSRQHLLPGWSRYQRTVGRDKPARELFVEMLRAQWTLLEAVEDNPESAGTQLTSACRAVQERLDLADDEPLSLGTAATLMFLASDERVPVSSHAALMMYQLVHVDPLQGALTGGSARPPVRKLLGAWVGRKVGMGTALQNMTLAMQFDLKEGIEPALELMRGTKVHARQKAFALMAVGKLGSKEHLPEILPLLADASVCASEGPRDAAIRTQIRDVALAVVVHLTGQSLKDYGFDRAEPAPPALFALHSLGFADEGAREAALRRWRERVPELK